MSIAVEFMEEYSMMGVDYTVAHCALTTPPMTAVTLVT